MQDEFETEGFMLSDDTNIDTEEELDEDELEEGELEDEDDEELDLPDEEEE